MERFTDRSAETETPQREYERNGSDLPLCGEGELP